MTQKQDVLMMLWDREWLCVSEFMRAYIPRYSARLFELRRDGWTLEKRRCQQHPHDLDEWRLAGTPSPMT